MILKFLFLFIATSFNYESSTILQNDLKNISEVFNYNDFLCRLRNLLAPNH